VVIDHTFVGTVIPTRTSLVGSTVEGRVVRFLVREGDEVEEGQTLAQLRLTALEIELAGAKASLALLEEQLEDLKVSQPQEIKQAEARMRAAKAQYEYANRQLQRGKGLVATAAITTEQLEEMVSLADSASSVLSERTSAYELANSIAPVKEAQALSRIEVQKETIRGLEDTISEHSITAPFKGYVTKEHTEVGQWIDKGGPVVELIELENVEVEVSVLESYVSELRQKTERQEGTKTVDMSLEALPGESFEGEIVSVVPRADTQSRTFPVKIRVQNRVPEEGGTPLLKPGMFARVTLPVRTVPQAIMVPKDALVLEKSDALAQNQPTVWVVVPAEERSGNGGRRVRPVKVTVAYDVSQGNMVQVTGPVGPDGSLPLRAGDLVITEGNERVNPNMTVLLKQPEASR
jgi:RND family efflux transporter MFP subunit